jgi:MFS family permease
MMLAGRAIQGIASQNSVMLAEMIVSDFVPLRERPKYIGMLLGLAGVSIISGPILGGFIVDRTTWRWVRIPLLPRSQRKQLIT